MDGGRDLARLQGRETRGGRRLRHLHAAVHETGDRRLAKRGDRILWLEAFLLEESAGDGGDERRVESGEAGELDADRLSHDLLPKVVTETLPHGAEVYPRASPLLRAVDGGGGDLTWPEASHAIDYRYR